MKRVCAVFVLAALASSCAVTHTTSPLVRQQCYNPAQQLAAVLTPLQEARAAGCKPSTRGGETQCDALEQDVARLAVICPANQQILMANAVIARDEHRAEESQQYLDQILAEPGRFLVASSATAVAQIIGKAVRDGKLCYYINDGVYQTYSGVIFDHCRYPLKSFKKGPTQQCCVFGPTCDALDTIGLSEELPDLELGEFLYAPNIGAYSAASATYFNGFPPAKVVHVNQ